MRRLLYPVLLIVASFSVLPAFTQKTSYPNTLLWRITGKNLQAPSYLFGTMHLQDRRIFQFPDSLYYYLEKAEGYAMEINPDETMAALLKALSDDDTTGLLKNEMKSEDFKKVSKDLENHFGVPAEKITKKQAWLYKNGWGNSKKSKADDMDAAIDTYLYNIAKRQGKWVGGIEDVEDQLNLIEELGEGFDAGDLLVAKSQKKTMLEKLIRLYISQDLNQIHEWITTMSVEEREKMLTRRNQKMAYRMDSMAHIRSNFFAVGAAHLPGDDGVINLLSKQGYKVEPVVSKKKIGPESYKYTEVELPWEQFEGGQKTFTVLMPGKAIPYKNEVMKMNIYADLGTGLIYFLSGMNITPGRNEDSALNAFARGFTHSKKSSELVRIEHNSKTGIETITQAEGYFYRLRFFVHNDQMLLMMIGAQKKTLLSHKEAEKFFQSLIFLAPVKGVATQKKKPWVNFKNEVKAFEVSFPDKPAINKDIADPTKDGEWIIYERGYMDLSTQVYYMLLVKETKPGYYISSNEAMFDGTRQNLEENHAVKITRYDTGRFHGHASLRMVGDYPENDISLTSLQVIRGNRSYTAMAVYNRGLSDTSEIEKYLNSFRLLDHASPDWKVQNGPGSSFYTEAPSSLVNYASMDTAASESNSYGYKLTSVDSMSNYSFEIYVDATSPYYFASSDSTYFADKLQAFLSADDSLVYSAKVQNGNISGMEYIIRVGEDGRNYKKLRIFLQDDSTYVLLTAAPEQDIRSQNFDRFFTGFRLKNYKPLNVVFANKAAKLLNDLNTNDSLLFSEASAYFHKAAFTINDLPLLHKALLLPYKDFSVEKECIHDEIVDKVISFKDSSTVTFIQDNYSQMRKEIEALKYPLLRSLASIRTEQSYTVLKNLLLHSKPMAGKPFGLAYAMDDSLKLTASIYPALFPLLKDSILSDVMVRVGKELLDSNLITADQLLPYQNDLIALAMERFNATLKSGDEDSWSYYNWINFIRRYNDAESNAFLQKITAVKSIDAVYTAALALIKNNQAIEAAVAAKLSSDSYYRLYWYRQLKNLDKLHLFSKKYFHQKSIGESELFSASSDDYEPSKMEYIGERKTNFMGKQKKFYLFKVHFILEDGDKETYLGIAGSYDIRSKEIVDETDATGLHHELFDSNKIEEQFKTYLEGIEQYLSERDDND